MKNVGLLLYKIHVNNYGDHLQLMYIFDNGYYNTCV